MELIGINGNHAILKSEGATFVVLLDKIFEVESQTNDKIGYYISLSTGINGDVQRGSKNGKLILEALEQTIMDFFKRPVKDDIDIIWPEDKKFQWRAIDGDDRSIFFYEAEPIIDEDLSWWANPDYRKCVMLDAINKDNGQDWRKSKMKRPEGV